MRKKRTMDQTPDVHEFSSPPDTASDVINMYGTYNVQRTVDTENVFPLIGHGLPKGWQGMKMGKRDVEDEE